MKIFNIFLFVYLLTAQLVRGQSQWQFMGPNEIRNIISINSKNDIFAASDSGLYRLSDNNPNWIKLNTNTVTSSIQCIYFNSNEDVFVGTATTGVFRSIDNGETWEAANAEIQNNSVYCITGNAANYIFIGTNEGVFKSTDNGNHLGISKLWICHYVYSFHFNKFFRDCFRSYNYARWRRDFQVNR